MASAAGGCVVAISPDGTIWDLPAGRPDSGESWEQTLRHRDRHQVTRLHPRPVPHRPERGTVLVRPVWLAGDELRPWEARFEIADRRVVPPAAAEEAFSLGSHPFAAIIRRELAEAALTR